MTDDRVAGLPDAGTIQPGDPGHIEVHDRMAELMQFAAERIGIILDPPAPKPAVIGEYGHVDAHNTLLANIEQIAREAGTAVGGPPAPVLTNPEGGSVVAFTSGGEGAGGPTIAYGAEIEPNDNGETVTVESDDPLVGGEVAVSNTQPFTDYIVSVYGVNVAGRGESATTDAFQLNYNEATGGTETIEDNYNGTGQKWKVHTFTGSGTFTVTENTQDFRVLVVGHGGSGGQGTAYGNGGGGGAGGVLGSDNHTIDKGDNPVTVAGSSSAFGFAPHNGGGGSGAGMSGNGSNGASGGGKIGGGSGSPGSGILGQGTNGGDNGGGGAGDGSSLAHTGAGRDTNIRNRSERFGNGGGGGYAGSGHGSGGAANTGNGGQGGGGTNPGGGGGSGIVIVAYQIGTSTTREIQQAQAEAAAREAGYATGYDVGVIDGIEQRNEEIRAAAEQVKEALPTKDKK